MKIDSSKFKLLKSYTWLKILSSIFKYVFLFSIAVVFLYPFLYMFITSVKSPNDLVDVTVTWIPHMFRWQNYIISFSLLNYFVGIQNSVIITFLSTFGHLLSCSFIAYGFARHNFRFKNFFFAIVIISLIIPIQTIIVPLYMQFSNIGWLNTILPLVVPTFFGFGLKGGLFIFLFRQFFAGLPKELEAAAQVDGCGPLKTFFKIILPASRTSFVVSFVLCLVWHWNDFYEPSLYLTEAKNWTLASMLPGMFTQLQNGEAVNKMMQMTNLDSITINEAVVMAATVLVILPILILFLFLQKQFMQGVERTGITE